MKEFQDPFKNSAFELAAKVAGFTKHLNTISKPIGTRGLIDEKLELFNRGTIPLASLANANWKMWEASLSKLTIYNLAGINNLNLTNLGMYKGGMFDTIAQQRFAVKTLADIAKNLGQLDNLVYQEYNLFPESDNEKEREERRKIIVCDNRIIQSIFDTVNDPKTIYKLTPRELEEYTAEIFRDKGFDIELTKQTRDGGYDILALRKLNGFTDKYLIECKRNREDRPIRIDIIRSFMRVVTKENANKGVIVTTSRFTRDAIKESIDTQYMLDLRDREDLIQWASEYFFNRYKQ